MKTNIMRNLMIFRLDRKKYISWWFVQRWWKANSRCISQISTIIEYRFWKIVFISFGINRFIFSASGSKNLEVSIQIVNLDIASRLIRLLNSEHDQIQVHYFLISHKKKNVLLFVARCFVGFTEYSRWFILPHKIFGQCGRHWNFGSIDK